MSVQTRIGRIEKDGPKGTGFTEWPTMNPRDLVSGEPVQQGHLYDEIADIDYSVGVWDCTAFVDKPGPYPVDEFMLLLEGSVQMIMPDGSQITVNQGDAFVIPKGLVCQWKMPVTVRKIFMILDGAAPTNTENASLHRITVPDLATRHRPPPGALICSETHFLNHDSRMRVCINSYEAMQRSHTPTQGRHMIHVLEGAVTFSDDPAYHFGQGESLYLRPGDDLNWTIAGGTRLLIATCDVPLS